MNHLFRFAWLLLTSPFRGRGGIFAPVRTYMRVWPTDLDPLLHMNNGVYLSLMDLGRIDLLARSGSWQRIRRAGIYPVVVSEAIRFRKSLTPFQKFYIRTHLVGWDERYFFLRQKFIVPSYDGEELYASAVIKGRFLKKGGVKVSPDELFAAAEIQAPERPAHDTIQNLLSDLDEHLRQ